MHLRACIPVCGTHAYGHTEFGVYMQWGANSLVISASDIDEGVRESLTKGSDFYELPVLRIHWVKLKDAAN